MNQSNISVCLQLLKKNPLKRLGAGERDANEVKGEKFFEVSNQYQLFVFAFFQLSYSPTCKLACRQVVIICLLIQPDEY